MAIAKLPAATDPFELSVTINVKLLPYFQIWYQRKKLDGETPEQFALRTLKTAGLNDYYADVIPALTDAIEQTKTDSLTELQTEIETHSTEVD